MQDKPEILVTAPIAADRIAAIRKTFTVHHAPWPDLATIARLGKTASAVWTNGTVGFSAAAMDAVPKLRIIAAQGAGTENIDLAGARERGIAVTNGAGTNASCVADHAFALLLSLVREIPAIDRLARSTEWASLRGDRPAISRKRLGIVGFGGVGQFIARRATGFDMDVAYHSRRPVAGSPLRHIPELLELARISDFLVLACPGGPATRHMVDAEVLEALGPSGYLVNVARGSVVDTSALIAALRSGTIAGAALDVYENEPGVPWILWDVPRLVLTPHLAGAAPEVRDEQIDLATRNFTAFFAGAPLVNVVA